MTEEDTDAIASDRTQKSQIFKRERERTRAYCDDYTVTARSERTSITVQRFFEQAG